MQMLSFKRAISARSSWMMAGPVALALACATSAGAEMIISYQVQALQPNSETLNGTTVNPSDLVNNPTGNLVFNAFEGDPILEDLDAAAIRTSNGNVIFSTDTNVDQAFPGLPGGFLNGDLIEWDGSTGSILLSESVFTAGLNPNISAFHLFESGPDAGKYVIGTKGTDDVLGGLALEWGNLALYDPGTDTSTLFFDQDLISGTLTQRTIDAVHVLDNGNIVISTLIDNGVLGTNNLQLKAKDLVEYDFGTGVASIFLDGTGLFDGSTRNLDAFAVPEPATVSMLALGLLGLAVGSRRRRD